ncbi:transcription factor PAP1-domain-containing protein [Aspergillus pseudoustus]|uniref:Transcription factor PAP1-domain-containing protein n=1 Tax=Aspergillus pseudoustus TaxID=1810923 RepID=A0ABR4KMF8_9EURO
MADFNTMYQHGLYLSPGEQDLLLAALSSNNPNSKQQFNPQKSNHATTANNTPGQASSGSFNASPAFDGSNSQFGNLNYDESPFLDFNPELDWDFPGSESLIGDLPGSAQSEEHEVGEKRKETDENAEEVSGKKRRESDDKGDDKAAKKPGRKPLTSEPTSKRKAQNRAAQRAFRERKEKHLKDLETKVDELQKASDDANQENGLLKAQVERLQVELREYRKRLSWVTHGNALSAINSYPGNANRLSGLNNNDFMFDFPKFGDLPGGRIFNGKNQDKAKDHNPIPGVLSRSSAPQAQPSSRTSTTASPKEATPGKSANASPLSTGLPSSHITNLSSFGFRQSAAGHETSTSDSPSSSSDSHQFLSSNGTSPEPSVQSPENKPHDSHEGHSCSIDGEASFCAQLGMACGNINNPVPAVRHRSESATNTPSQQANPNTFENTDNFQGLDFFAQQNGNAFDPTLFGDWRESQNAVLSQEFNTFFDDAFPLPDLGSPSHNLTEAGTQVQQPKKSILDEIDSRMDEEVVPGEDKAQMLSCTKIWDRLQSMEKFRNGEIDVDNLCSELRTKARCSEGGVVVNQRDVDDIIGRS